MPTVVQIAVRGQSHLAQGFVFGGYRSRLIRDLVGVRHVISHRRFLPTQRLVRTWRDLFTVVALFLPDLLVEHPDPGSHKQLGLLPVQPSRCTKSPRTVIYSTAQ